MIEIQVNNLVKSFEVGKNVLDGLTFQVDQGERVGLLGRNGAGKTTLFKILTGELDYDEGTVVVGQGRRVGLISQIPVYPAGCTVEDVLRSAFARLESLAEEMRALEARMAAGESDPAILKRYGTLSERFEAFGGYDTDVAVNKIANGLSIPDSQRSQLFDSLSGGEKTRLSFVKLLLKKPPLLLLDEPTNYLDLDTLDWLEAFLKNYLGAILTVSHDQYFLDHLATQIFELQHGELTVFKGNYSQYLAQRELRDQQQEAAYEKQQEEIKREEEFIQKNIVRASTTKQAQSRRKALEKMELVDPPKHKSKVRIKFDSARPSGKEVLILKDLAVGYPDKTMLKDISFQINKGDRVAIIGQNGIGKSTLLKTVMKQLPVKSGAIKYGASLDIGYYDQELQGLDYSKTVIDTIWDRHKDMNEKDIRSILASFLFTAKDIDKQVSQLSGGQRARLTLTVLSMEHNNFLLMDEPTNHLDLDAKEVLEKALADYDGTLLFVSHDRYFINKLANKIVVAKDGQAKIYEGNYTYYLNEKAKEEAAAQETAAQEAPVVKAVSESKFSYQEQKKRDSEKRKLERQVAQAEKDLEELEAKEQEIQEAMADPAIAADFSKLGPLQEELTAVQEKISQVSQAWEDASLALEEF